MSFQPKIYADKYRMVMVWPATWTCEGCGFRWSARLKALDVNVVVSGEDENRCEKCSHFGVKTPERQVIYRDRRCGVTWPGANNPGYFVIFGQQDAPSPTVYKQTDMLVEAEEENMERFFDKLTAGIKKLYCTWVLCDRNAKHDHTLYSLADYIRKRHIKLQLLGVEDICGFEESRPIIDDMIKNDQLFIPTGTILRGQSGRLTPQDLHIRDRVGPEERFWAVNAMHYCVASWRAYPWKKPGKQEQPRIQR